MEELNDSQISREGFGISCLGFTVYALVILLSNFFFFFFFEITHKKRKTSYFKKKILINQIQNFMVYQNQLS